MLSDEAVEEIGRSRLVDRRLDLSLTVNQIYYTEQGLKNLLVTRRTSCYTGEGRLAQ